MKNNLSNFLVSGASGFIGENFISHLHRNGFMYEKFERVDWSVQQLHSSSKFESALFGDDILALFQDKTNFVHLAAKYEKAGLETDPAGIIEANVTYSFFCLRIASFYKLHFTSVSSIQQFNGTDSIYAKSKSLFDAIIECEKTAGLKSSRLIIGDTFGDDDTRPKIINYILTETLKGKSPELSHPRNLYAPVDVIDVTKKLFDISQQEGDYKLIPEESINLESLVKMCEEISARKIDVKWKFKESKPNDWEYAPGEKLICKNNLLRFRNCIAKEWDKKCLNT